MSLSEKRTKCLVIIENRKGGDTDVIKNIHNLKARFQQRIGLIPGQQVEVQGEQHLQAVAALLGFSASALRKGLTSRTHSVRGQLVKSLSDANMSR